MRKEFTHYFKNKKIRNIVLVSLAALFLFVLTNGAVIYIFNPQNDYFYLVEKIIPYPAFSIGREMITVGAFNEDVNSNKRIYEAAYRVDFSSSIEGAKNSNQILEMIKKEMIDCVIMKGILTNLDKAIKQKDITGEYKKILEGIGDNTEIGKILKYSTNVKEADVKNKIYTNLLTEKVKEEVVYNLKMKVLVFKPGDINNQEEWTRTQKKAAEISAELKQNPSSFDQYQSLYNDQNDFIVNNFGREYYFAEDLPEEFRESFKTFYVGKISDPIKGSNGYYIFKVEDSRGYYSGSLNDFLNEQRGKIKIRYFLR